MIKLNQDKLLEIKRKTFETLIQQRLDDFARVRGFDNILSAASYATSTNAKFSADGLRCVQLRDDTWAAMYEILNDVNTGARPAPGSIDDIEDELPKLVW
ncbi:MAG: hypothetical protein IBX55_08910 [Methyloprofundus sp.]|nr:hypothetical protein [Methyloprofundus sp.]